MESLALRIANLSLGKWTVPTTSAVQRWKWYIHPYNLTLHDFCSNNPVSYSLRTRYTFYLQDPVATNLTDDLTPVSGEFQDLTFTV